MSAADKKDQNREEINKMKRKRKFGLAFYMVTAVLLMSAPMIVRASESGIEDMSVSQSEGLKIGADFMDARAGGISWQVDGDTVVIRGEGYLSGIEDELRDAMASAKKVRFEECKILGSMVYGKIMGFFFDLENLESIDLEGLDTSQVTNMQAMFSGCSSLTSLDVSGFDTSQVTSMREMFLGCSSLTSLDVSGFDTSQVTDMGGMFERCGSLTSLDVSGFDTSRVTNMQAMFSGCSSLTSLDVSRFDTSQVTDMGFMFSDCSSLTGLDLSGFDTSNVTNMRSMFTFCESLTNLDMSGFDTSRVTDMWSMFERCSSLMSLDVSGFDTSRVTDMGGMFSDCGILTSLDVSGFNTGQVTDMWNMFGGCSSLTSLDLSGFDTSWVMNMGVMFFDCSGLTSLDLSGFNTSQVTDMDEMFSGCSGLTSLDLSSFDTSNVIEDVENYCYGMRDMFSGCTSLNTIRAFRVPPVQAACDLPCTYADENGNQTTQITAAFAGKTLTRLPQDKPEFDHGQEQQVRNFVSRMYTVALGREAEEAGLEDWTSRLLNHETDGAGIANGFIMSDEFKNKKTTDEDYVDILYRTFFDRNADQGGRATWLGTLENGNSRTFVLAGFVNSVEFDNLCGKYGIRRGNMESNEAAIGLGVKQFVNRCYLKVLGREGEEAGVADWTGRIARGEQTPESVAKLFFFSEEYANKNTSNEEFVETLYQTFMDRASDPAGKADWVGRLLSGTSREGVLEGFSRSEEFAGILQSFGL